MISGVFSRELDKKKALKALHKMLSGLLAETIAIPINKYASSCPFDGT
jgi:hypothetical protein